MVDEFNSREASQRFDLHRDTISNMLQFSALPGL
jgi:hypothetical protein